MRLQPLTPTPRFKVRWRAYGRVTRRHAFRIVEGGRLDTATLCGRNAGRSLWPGEDKPECQRCADLLEPVAS